MKKKKCHITPGREMEPATRGHRYTFSGNRENGGKKTDSQLLRSTPTYDRVEREQTRFTTVVPRGR